MSLHLAIDLGASGGRHILGRLEQGRIVLQEVYRFENRMERRGGHLCWNTEELYGHILAGLDACRAAGQTPHTLAIDSWGVDFVLLDGAGERLGEAVAYRDERTAPMVARLEGILPFEQLYARTGIQKMPINTIYHLMAMAEDGEGLLDKAAALLMMPDYFQYRLTGQTRQEYTNATTTSLVNAHTRGWDGELLDTLGLPRRLFGPLAQPGETLGPFSAETAARLGFSATVLSAPSHDTASAYLAVPAKDENAVYISSGTWSLLGMESEAPILTNAARAANFTNEGGCFGKTRFLKNIMGLWMVQSLRREYDKKYSYAEMEQMAREEAGFTSLIDVNDDRFLAPASMAAAIQSLCEETGQPVPQTLGQQVQCVYQSLAALYAKAVANLEAITGRRFASINIVGGGSKDGYLNQLTANATGLPVYAGPEEGTVIGNVASQMLAAGELADLAQARACVAASFPLKTFLPA